MAETMSPRLALLLEAPPSRVLWRLATPNVLTAVLMTAVTVADAWFVGQLGIAVLAMFEEDPRAPALLIRLLTCTSQYQAVSAAARCARPRAVALALCAGLACSFAVSRALAPGPRGVWSGWGQAWLLDLGLGAG